VPLNYTLVTYAHAPKPLAYAAVLVFQVSMNFIMCRWLVFSERNERHAAIQFMQFIAGITGFRILDWALYSFAVYMLGVPFLLMQLANVAIFALLKYWVSFRIIGKR
jgi:putative flippase GtrA